MKNYKVLNNQVFSDGEFFIVPIRFTDRMAIMKWRNEQMYHLRQAELLTTEMQDNYFKTTVNQLFDQKQPEQLLFSFLKNGKCIGYGGLVHINWIDRNAEISFIMDTELEKKSFELLWSCYLGLIEKVAFEELQLNEIFTYAYNLRPRLYPVLEQNGFKHSATLKDQLIVDGESVDVLIHQKKNELTARRVLISDVDLIYSWSNDDLVRKQSYSSDKINYVDHCKWFRNKLESKNSFYLIFELEELPVGFVRFDLGEKNTTIGVLIDKHFRGKGLASKFLKLGAKIYFRQYSLPILANIKKDNIASIKSFEKAGFLLGKEEDINNIPSFVYQLLKGK